MNAYRSPCCFFYSSSGRNALGSVFVEPKSSDRSHSEKKRLPCGRAIDVEKPIKNTELERRWNLQLRDFLTEQGLKYTEQRWKIAQLILSHPGHVSAQEIIDRVRNQYPEIGVATIYRNIKVLCDAEILKESLVTESGTVVYEKYAEDHHDHMVCIDCGEIFEFHDPQIESQQNKVASGMGFKAVSHKHVIYAHCERLKK